MTLLREISRHKEGAGVLVARFQLIYRKLQREDRPSLFDALLREIEVQRAELEPPMQDLLSTEDDDPIQWTRSLTQLRRKLESPRVRAFRRFLSAPGGLLFLLDLRADILAAQRDSKADLEPLDEEIAHLFTSWFQGGFLFLKEITLESSFQQIQFLKEHDMVHPMASLDEMGSRLGGDRRLFALCHRAMPEQPVVFIEVALTGALARSIHEILGGASELRANGAPSTAIFYSINNTQNGLARLGLGKALIVQVVESLRADYPSIKVFATLSPLPGLWERYLKLILLGEDQAFALKRDGLIKFFPRSVQEDLIESLRRRSGDETKDFPSTLLAILSDPGWIEDRSYYRWLERPLTELAYFYITSEQNRFHTPLNPVAAFHLGNGARVSKRNINFGANRSERGLRESCGLMVNFVYSTTWVHQIRRTMRSFLPWSP